MEFTQEYLKSLKNEYAGNASDSQFELWIQECQMRNLVPVKDVVLQIRAVKEWDAEAKAKVFKKKAIYITTIQALRKLAERTGKYAGQLPSKWVYLDASGHPSIESEIPLPETGDLKKPKSPWAAKASVLRKGFEAPITVPARFEAYAQYFKGDDGQVLNSTWATRGPEQLEKCAEALALRKAFPEELGGLYLNEELKDEEDFQMVASASVEETPVEGKKRGRPKKETPSVFVPPLEPVQKTDKRAEFPFGNNTGETPAPEPNVTEREISPINDEDVPSNIGEKPTPERLAEIGVTVKKIVPQKDMHLLGKYLRRAFPGKSGAKDLTLREWTDTIYLLEKAKAEGKLSELLEEKK